MQTDDTSLVRLETSVIVHVDDELEVPQQEKVEASENQESLVQDPDLMLRRRRRREWWFLEDLDILLSCFH